MTTLDIQVRGVHKTYGRGPRAVQALSGVDLEIPRGQVFGLLGQNGAGKTTLVKILLDIVRPTEGEAQLLGQPSRGTGARRDVGYLPEDHRFPEYLHAGQVLALYGGLSHLGRRQVRQRTAALLELVGLADVGGLKVRAYSKGMKQRLGLAQALVHEPQVLFLDEPTDGVDPLGRREIRSLIQRLKDEGKTIFLNSHLLSEVEQICDRVAFVTGGRIVREGTIDELTNTGGTWRLRTTAPIRAAHLEGLDCALQPPAPPPADPRDRTLHLPADAREDAIDRVVDAIRAQGIGIRHLEMQRLSLEELFVNLHEPQADAAAEGDDR